MALDIPSPSDHCVSREVGFLSTTPPIQRLTNPRYDPWENTASKLPTLIEQRRLRAEVHRLPILPTTPLQTWAEWTRAYVCLVFLTNAYVWGDDEPATVLPSCLSIPLLEVCNHLEVPPLATYAGVCLWNYSLRSPTGCVNRIEDLRSNTSFTGTPDEEWFYMVSVTIEAQGGPSIMDALDAIKAAYDNNHERVASYLNSISKNLRQVSTLLGRMNERCAPRAFYMQLRPFLAGTNRMKEFGLRDGLYYDHGHGTGLYRSYKGGSNAQSTLMQFFDVVLGVQHHSNDSTGSSHFMTEMRSYMPGPHRRFLEAVSKVANIKAFVDDNQSHSELQAAYNSCIQGLCHLRDKHFQIVTRYVILPSQKAASLNGCSNPSKDDSHPRGTGGTDLIRFLQNAREDTVRCRIWGDPRIER